MMKKSGKTMKKSGKTIVFFEDKGSKIPRSGFR